MSPREMAHRGREQFRAQKDRIFGPPAPRVESFKKYVSGTPANHFYSSHREDLRPFVQNNFPHWIGRAVEEAEKLCRHEIQLLGYPPARLGPQIDWHRDPITGRTWEREFWTGYRPVHDTGGRDAKVIHELNRHQHLPRLAKAYFLTGDERYAAEAVAQLNSWIDQNPPGQGINWQSSLEIGIRAISWLWTIFPILRSRSFDGSSAQRIGDSLFAQFEHVHRYTSLYTSPNTHLIGEASALFIGGLVFQDQKRPAVWLRTATALLNQSAQDQVLDDGVYGELSSCYHCYALDFFLQAAVLASQNGLPTPEPIQQKTLAMLQFLMHLTRPDGTLPSLGDDDGGRALALDRTNYRSFQDGLCLGAILYGRGDFKYTAGAFFEETMWMLGQSAWDTWRQLERQKPSATSVHYPHAGYVVRRSCWEPGASHLIFDCGGLGILTGGHAHADALAITLFSGGREVLADPGTFVYNCAPEWRSYFRSTRAHNTVTVDGRDQAEQGGTFRWKTRICCRATHEFTSGGLEYVEGEHDGYRRLPQGVIHRRRLLTLSPGHWLVADDFRGTGEHAFEFHYHFSNDFEESELTLFASLPVAKSCIEGWVSRGYGEKQACTTLRATMTGAAPAAAMTFLGDSGEPVVRQLPLESGAGIACACEHHGVEDIIVVSTGNSEIAVAGFRLSGEFFCMRLENGALKQVLAAQAVSMDREGRTIFRRSEAGPFAGAIGAGSDEKALCAEFAGS
jgi:Heparinase II/III-like protein/Heparinase II/III N-terminus